MAGLNERMQPTAFTSCGIILMLSNTTRSDIQMQPTRRGRSRVGAMVFYMVVITVCSLRHVRNAP